MPRITPIGDNPFNSLLSLAARREGSEDFWRWGTVISVDPVRVRLDGDTAPLAGSPDTLCPVNIGDRVRLHVYNRRATIMGVSGGAQPEPEPEPDVPVVGDRDVIVVDGVEYVRSGVKRLPSHSLVADSGWDKFKGVASGISTGVRVPVGWRVAYFVVDNPTGSGWIVACNSDANNKLWYLQYGGTVALQYIGWVLVQDK